MAFASTARRLALLPTAPRLAFAPTAPRLVRGNRNHPNWTEPTAIAKAAAKTASTPHKLRIKTAKKQKRELQPGEADVLPDGLMRGEAERLLRVRLHWKDYKADLDDHALLAELRAKEYRVRGVVNGQVVGKRVYLPNFLFTMVMNPTEPGHAYNPYEATFRVGPSITKLDIRGYLSAVYGLDVTYIRTVIYDGFVAKRWDRKARRRGLKVHPTYKRVTVGLKEPFYFPLMLEDMSTQDRDATLAKYEEVFHPKERTAQMMKQRLRMYNDVSMSEDIESRREILARIAKRKADREAQVQKNLGAIRAERLEREAAAQPSA